MDLTALADLATVIGVVIALIAAGIAVYQIRAARFSQREATAIGMYRDYLTLCIQYPRLAGAHPDVRAAKGGDSEFEQYEWFVASMLFACEQILDLTPGVKAWRDVVKTQITYHKEYVSSPTFIAEHYSRELQKLIVGVTQERIAIPHYR